MHEHIRSAFADVGLDISLETATKFHTFYNMLVNANYRTNLTAITDFDEVLQKHFLDSCAPALLGMMNGVSNCIDVGTGAGFPGLPLTLIYPEIQFTLIDSTNKKVQFIRQVVQAMNIGNCMAMQARAEMLAREPEHREIYDIAVSRAVTDLPALCEYCLPFVKVGGRLLAYRGDDRDISIPPLQPLGATAYEVKSVPIAGMEHYIACIYKGRNTEQKYPRRQQAIYNRPLA